MNVWHNLWRQTNEKINHEKTKKTEVQQLYDSILFGVKRNAVDIITHYYVENLEIYCLRPPRISFRLFTTRNGHFEHRHSVQCSDVMLSVSRWSSGRWHSKLQGRKYAFWRVPVGDRFKMKNLTWQKRWYVSLTPSLADIACLGNHCSCIHWNVIWGYFDYVSHCINGTLNFPCILLYIHHIEKSSPVSSIIITNNNRFMD
jgi:hypothetical protein